MPNSYFKRVHEQTPTRFWINNPTLQQAQSAIDAGAVGCTTNPSYVSELLNSPDDLRCVLRAVDLLLPYEKDDVVIATKVQRIMVSKLSDLFLPLYRESDGKAGFVTIQGNPFKEEHAGDIIDEGLENRKAGANVMVQIPVTAPGIQAIETLVGLEVPVTATEVMALSQAASIREAYQKASQQSGKQPPWYVNHITGMLDDHFKRVVAANRLDIPVEALRYAGLSIAKRQYKLFKECQWPGTMIGGARKLEDFTELVGADMAITINWEGMADVLLQRDEPVVQRIQADLDEGLTDVLKKSLPDYRRAWALDGMHMAEYYDFGGVKSLRSSFQEGWNQVLALIAERRKS